MKKYKCLHAMHFENEKFKYTLYGGMICKVILDKRKATVIYGGMQFDVNLEEFYENFEPIKELKRLDKDEIDEFNSRIRVKCPICGNAARLDEHDYYDQLLYSVSCKNLCLITKKFEKPNEAIDFWNGIGKS